MKEEEAKKKSCPINILTMGIVIAANAIAKLDADLDEVSGSMCIASNCMMWKNNKDDYPEEWQDQAEEGGYCGLAK